MQMEAPITFQLNLQQDPKNILDDHSGRRTRSMLERDDFRLAIVGVGEAVGAFRRV
jgi:hypothetical protein